jgi:HPt (histidine-containing phosphotransfer) domain-containing protein
MSLDPPRAPAKIKRRVPVPPHLRPRFPKSGGVPLDTAIRRGETLMARVCARKDEALGALIERLVSLAHAAADPIDPASQREITAIAHDLRGLGGMLGLPIVTHVADTLHDLAAPDRRIARSIVSVLSAGMRRALDADRDGTLAAYEPDLVDLVARLRVKECVKPSAGS